MRKLNSKQKSLISNWVNQNKDNLSIFVSAEDLPYELYSELERINDFETLNQEIQRFASDVVNESKASEDYGNHNRINQPDIQVHGFPRDAEGHARASWDRASIDSRKYFLKSIGMREDPYNPFYSLSGYTQGKLATHVQNNYLGTYESKASEDWEEDLDGYKAIGKAYKEKQKMDKLDDGESKASEDWGWLNQSDPPDDWTGWYKCRTCGKSGMNDMQHVDHANNNPTHELQWTKSTEESKASEGIYEEYVNKFGDNQSLGGGFGDALRANDLELAFSRADTDNYNKLKELGYAWTGNESKANEFNYNVLIKGKPSKEKLRDEFAPYVNIEDDGENTRVIFDGLVDGGKQELESLGYDVIGESKASEVNIERSDGSMKIDGKNVIKIWETMNGWYHYAVEDHGKYTGVGADGNDVEAHEWFGYTQGDYNEWGYFDSKEFDRNPMVWEVPKSNWGWTGRSEEAKASESVTIDDFKRIKDNFQAEKLNFEQGSALVDVQTANAIVAVWDNINEEQRLKFPLHLTSAHNVARLAGIAFKSSGGWLNESKASEVISDNDKQILSDWVSQNKDWTTIDDLPREIFIPLMASFGDDIDKRVEAQVEIIDYMESLGEVNVGAESWNQKSSINRIEALERVGLKQGDAIKLSGLEFNDFGEDLQGALKGDVEDARTQMKQDKHELDGLGDYNPNDSEDAKTTGLGWQEGGEVDNPNSEFDQNYPDYNNIGKSQTNMTNYECEFCDNGFESNESLMIHHNDKHAIAPEALDGYDYAEKPYWQKVSERTIIHKNFDPIWGSTDRANDDDLQEYGKPESSEGDSLKCSHCGQTFNPDNEQVLYSHLAGHGITESKASEVDIQEDYSGNVTIDGKPVKKMWSSRTGWIWYGLRNEGNGRWFGYVEGNFPEYGYFDENELNDLMKDGSVSVLESYSKASEMSTSEWENKIEKLSNKKGVKKIAVQNFLGTVGSNPDYMSASMNAEMDAGMYGWNYATQGAIHEGISIFFNQVKSNENEDDENDAVKNLEIMRGIGAKLYSNFGHLSKEEREKKGLWFGDDVGMSDESKANEADCTNCGQSGVDPDPRFQLGSWCEDCQDRLELAKDNWWKNATDEEKRKENEWNDKPWESGFDGEAKASESFDMHTDAGHGWLEVPKSLLKELGIGKDISMSSYQKGNNVFIEEDGDFVTFKRAYEEKYGSLSINELPQTDDESPIRDYYPYSGESKDDIVDRMLNQTNYENDWKIDEEVSEAETMDCPVCKNPNAPKMDRVDGMCKDCIGRLLGESKANEIGMHGNDGASFYDGKTFTCSHCGKVGDSFTDMAQEECPNNDRGGHQIPIFGDQLKSKRPTRADVEASETQDDFDFLYNEEDEEDYNKSSEAGAEDHICAECGFVTSDNSEYIDHLNSHED
jgi:hypothetical protein